MRIAQRPGFVFEPESRAGYAAQLGIPRDHPGLRNLWEAYQDGEDGEYELLRLDNDAEIFACIYRHYVTVLIGLQGGQETCWGDRPVTSGRFALRVELGNVEQGLLLENRRLARLMLADVEMDDPYLDDSLLTHQLEVWAPASLRRLAVDAAAEFSGGGVSKLAKLNSKMCSQIEQGTAIYRWYDTSRRAIYYGVAGDLAVRQDQHALTSKWSVFAAYCEVTRVSTRRLALDEERRLIQQDLPIFNRQHNDTPEARDRYMLYLAEHGRLDLAT